MANIESYLIPTPATESVLTSTVDYDNKKLIDDKYPMIIFCPQSKGLYKKPFMKLLKDYNYQGGIVFELGALLTSLLKGEPISADLTVNVSEELIAKLTKKLKMLSISSTTNINEVCLAILEACREFMYYNDIMIGIYSEIPSDYELIVFRHYPVMIFNPSLWKSIINRSSKSSKMTIREAIRRNREFDHVLGSGSGLRSQPN